MRYYLNFHYYNCFIYILIRTIGFILNDIVRKKNEKIFSHQSLNLFYRFLGESFAIFFYYIEKKNVSFDSFIYKKRTFMMNKIEGINDKKKKIKSYNFFIIIFCCSLSYIFYSLKYKSFFNNEMKELLNIYDLRTTLFIFFLFCNEHYFLNIQTYNHHYLGITLILFYLIFLFIKNYDLIIGNFHFNYLLYLFIIYSEIGFIGSIPLIIEKKLNFEYYVNVYYICFIEGIFALVLIFLYIMISIFIFNDNSIILLLKEINNINNFFYCIIIIFLYCLINLIITICRLKISEKNRPSYNSISNLLTSFFLNIDPFNNPYILIDYFFSLFGSFIFCEVITLAFCNLDKNTFYRTSNRAINDNISIDISSDIDCDD